MSGQDVTNRDAGGVPAPLLLGAEQQFKNSVIYLVPLVVGSIAPLLTLPVITRVLSTEEYGAWALASAYAVFVTGVANFGLMVTYERNFFEYRRHDEAARLLYSVVAFVLCAFCACAFATWWFRMELARWLMGSPRYAPLLFWTCCASAATSLKAYYLVYFRNTANAKAYVSYTVDETVLGAACSLLFVAYLELGVTGLAYAQLVASVIVLALASAKCVRTLPPRFSGTILMSSLKTSYPLLPRIFLGALGGHFDKFLIRLLGSVDGVGVYAIGQRIAYFVFVVSTALENVFNPQVYERMFAFREKGVELVGRYLTPFVYASVACALVVALFAREMLFLLAPAAYQGAVPVVGVLSLYYGVLFFGKQPQLLFAKRTLILSLLSGVSLAFHVGLSFMLIPRWGIIGAALGTLIAGTISTGIYVVVGQRYYRIAWEYRAIAAVLALLVAGVVGSVVLNYVDAPYWLELSAKAAILIGYAGVGARLGVISRENYQMVRTLAGRRFKVDLPGPASA